MSSPKTTFLPKLQPFDEKSVVQFTSQIHWGVSKPERFSSLMEEAKSLVAPGYFFGDNLFTWLRNNSALEDVHFRNSWQSNIQNPSDEAIVWRRYILACAGYHCAQLEGDFVECGVYLGTGIKTVVDYLGGLGFPKTFWGFDTFDFNPAPGHKFTGQSDGLFEKVSDRFKDYKQVRIVQGHIPSVFDDHSPDKIAYLHIDLNHLEAEIAALEALFDRVTEGGIVVLDDYEWSGVYRSQKIGEAHWFDQRGYRVFPLPTGQGVVIKRGR